MIQRPFHGLLSLIPRPFGNKAMGYCMYRPLAIYSNTEMLIAAVSDGSLHLPAQLVFTEVYVLCTVFTGNILAYVFDVDGSCE